MDGSEYLKYVTERVVSYMDRPKEEKPEKPAGKIKEPWLTKWFGVAPIGLRIWWGSRALRKNKTRQEAARSANSSAN
ncbi:YqzE family protein [Cohnella hongkongensis]|uniref:YqzE family protein n=1 Tax=Cohnella hongkongensis TaxID=178337 RepID=A0ABV9F457_9BACL